MIHQLDPLASILPFILVPAITALDRTGRMEGLPESIHRSGITLAFIWMLLWCHYYLLFMPSKYYIIHQNNPMHSRNPNPTRLSVSVNALTCVVTHLNNQICLLTTCLINRLSAWDRYCYFLSGRDPPTLKERQIGIFLGSGFKLMNRYWQGSAGLIIRGAQKNS